MAATNNSVNASKLVIPTRQLCQWRIGRERSFGEKIRDTFRTIRFPKCYPTDHIAWVKDEDERSIIAERILGYLAGQFECMSWLFYPADNESLLPAAGTPPQLPRNHEFYDLGGRRDMWNMLEAGFKEIHEEFAKLYPIQKEFKTAECPVCSLKQGFTIALKRHLGQCHHLGSVDYAFNKLSFDEQFMATLFELDPKQCADSASTPKERDIINYCNHTILWLTLLLKPYTPVEQVQPTEEDAAHGNRSASVEEKPEKEEAVSGETDINKGKKRREPSVVESKKIQRIKLPKRAQDFPKLVFKGGKKIRHALLVVLIHAIENKRGRLTEGEIRLQIERTQELRKVIDTNPVLSNAKHDLEQIFRHYGFHWVFVKETFHLIPTTKRGRISELKALCIILQKAAQSASY